MPIISHHLLRASTHENRFLHRFVDLQIEQTEIAALASNSVFSTEAEMQTQIGIRWHSINVRSISSVEAMLNWQEPDFDVFLPSWVLGRFQD